jgi:site-specific recombinase XerC
VLVGLRDRALIAVMVYSFARINAVLEMKVWDYFVQGRRGWVRLHEKGGKEHEVPCHHNLELYLDEYIAAADIAGDPDGPLFRTAAGKIGDLTDNAMWQQDAVNAGLNCHFFTDTDVPRLRTLYFSRPTRIAGCAGKLRCASAGRFG